MDTRGDDENRLFAGKVPGDSSKEELEGHFAQFGTVVDCFIPTSTKAQKIAFVTFSDKKELYAALAAEHSIRGNILNCVKAEPRNAKRGPSGSGPGYAGSTSDSNRVFVGGLNGETTEEDLMVHFSKFGTTVQVNRPSPATSTKGGFSFITFSNPDEVAACLLANPHIIKGSSVRVVEARPKPTPFSSYSYGVAPASEVVNGGFGYQPAAAAPKEEAKRLFVGRIPQGTTKEELTEYFQAYGDVKDCFIPNSTKNSKTDFYAFVTYTQVHDMYKVLAVPTHNFKDAELSIVQARPKPNSNAATAPVQMAPQYGQVVYGQPAYQQVQYAQPAQVVYQQAPVGQPYEQMQTVYAPYGGQPAPQQETNPYGQQAVAYSPYQQPSFGQEPVPAYGQQPKGSNVAAARYKPY